MAGQDVELVVHEQPGGAELAPYKRLPDDAMAGDATPPAARARFASTAKWEHP